MKSIILPIKGTYYYAAEQAEQEGLLMTKQSLNFVEEPDNPYDPYAIQVWLPQVEKSLLLGYIPKTHSRQISRLHQSHRIQTITIDSSYRQYHRLFIHCRIDYQNSWLLSLSVWLNQLFNVFSHAKIRAKK